MPIPSLRCLLGKHRPVDGEVLNHGLEYRSTCRSCGAAIRRIKPKKWVKIYSKRRRSTSG